MKTEQFNALKREEKAVLVAEDIISQVKAHRVIANAGNYFSIPFDGLENYQKSRFLDVKENLDKLKTCSACALGSALLSTTKFANQLKFNQLESFDEEQESLDLLETVFTPKQMLLIETAFENYYEKEYTIRKLNREIKDCEGFEYDENGNSRIGADKYDEELTENEVRACIKFHNKYKTDGGRLIAIAKNIIKNKGTFIP